MVFCLTVCAEGKSLVLDKRRSDGMEQPPLPPTYVLQRNHRLSHCNLPSPSTSNSIAILFDALSYRPVQSLSMYPYVIRYTYR